MSNQLTPVRIDVENSVTPEGYEFTGEYRFFDPSSDDAALVGSASGVPSTQSRYYPILRKLKPKRWRARPEGVYFHVRIDAEAQEASDLIKQTLTNCWANRNEKG